MKETLLKELRDIFETNQEIEKIEIKFQNGDVDITVESNDILPADEMREITEASEDDRYAEKALGIIFSSAEFMRDLKSVLAVIYDFIESDKRRKGAFNKLFEDVRNANKKNYCFQVIEN